MKNISKTTLVQNICESMISICLSDAVTDCLWNTFAGNVTVCETLSASLADLGVTDDCIEDFFEISVEGGDLKEDFEQWLINCVESVNV